MRNAFPLAAIFLAMTATAFAQGDLPAGAIKRGSLANAKLAQDAKLGVAAKVATMGCSQPAQSNLSSSRCRAARWAGDTGRNCGSCPVAAKNIP